MGEEIYWNTPDRDTKDTKERFEERFMGELVPHEPGECTHCDRMRQWAAARAAIRDQVVGALGVAKRYLPAID